MNTIKLAGIVKEDGLFCNDPELKKYLNQEVNVIIFPKETNLESNEDWKNILSNHIKSFDEDTIKAFSEALHDCRKINPESWT